ncbi:MAG: hypothetical protein GX910_05360 [Clostridiaceae bacterium]|jgi:hypothetical protein|nr:hypothetical protein [Clostridiaceae bacterium]
MPLKEGKCINCGSLLMLDPSMPKGHCLFCDCVFDNEEAFRAFEHPEEFTFPNDPQPPYTGPSLVPLPYQRGPVVVTQSAAAVKKKDDFVLPKKDIPDVRIPRKVFFSIVGIALAIAGIFSAITIPMMNRKKAQYTKISERFVEVVNQPITSEKNLAIHNLSHNRVILVLHEDISDDEGVRLFNEYCDIRADVLDMKDRSFKSTREPITFRIAMPSGDLSINNPKDEAAIVDNLHKE